MNYLVIGFRQGSDKYVIMRKRTGNDIWKNLYDFPCIETESTTDVPSILSGCENEGWIGGMSYVIKHVSDEYIHQLSHRRLVAKFIRIEVTGKPELPADFSLVKKEMISELPLPRLIDRYLATFV